MKPSVFEYYDYQEYFKDWLAFSKAGQSDFSFAAMATKAKLSPSLLSMYFGGQRKMTVESLSKISKAMSLNRSEQKFLELLWIISESEDRNEKIQALAQLKKYQEYKQQNHSEEKLFRYLSKWLYVAVRELVKDPNFKEDPEWIQSRILFKVSLQEIRNALDFLIENEFLIRDTKGRLMQKDNQIDCQGVVLKMALSQFHTQMFELTIRSISEVSSDNRNILGHTAHLNKAQFAELNKSMQKIIDSLSESSLGGSTPEGEVYHISLATIPLTETVSKNQRKVLK